jgi:hypothetical protein
MVSRSAAPPPGSDPTQAAFGRLLLGGLGSVEALAQLLERLFDELGPLGRVVDLLQAGFEVVVFGVTIHFVFPNLTGIRLCDAAH